MRLGAGAEIGCERFSIVFAIALLIFNIVSLMFFNADVSVELFNISRNSFFSRRSSLASLIRNGSLCDADRLRSRCLLFSSMNFMA